MKIERLPDRKLVPLYEMDIDAIHRPKVEEISNVDKLAGKRKSCITFTARAGISRGNEE